MISFSSVAPQSKQTHFHLALIIPGFELFDFRSLKSQLNMLSTYAIALFALLNVATARSGPTRVKRESSSESSYEYL
jgi:hypothetical protein